MFRIRLQSFKWKIENKNIFAEAKTLDDRERCLALEMPTSRMAHVDRERENAKQQQGKARVTKAQQD
jgi:hypothetical protein